MARPRVPQTGRTQPESGRYSDQTLKRVWRLYLSTKVLGYLNTFDAACRSVASRCGLTPDQVRYVIHNLPHVRKNLWG